MDVIVVDVTAICYRTSTIARLELMDASSICDREGGRVHHRYLRGSHGGKCRLDVFQKGN